MCGEINTARRFGRREMRAARVCFHEHHSSVKEYINVSKRRVSTLHIYWTFLIAVGLALPGTAYAQSLKIGPGETGGATKPVMIPAHPDRKQSPPSKWKKASDELKASYIGPCNSSYTCYNGTSLNCNKSRPYEQFNPYQCYCYEDPVCR